MEPEILQRGRAFFNRCDVWMALTLNRMLHLRGVQRFFAAISSLGDGKLWYTLMLCMPLLVEELQWTATWHMCCVGLVTLTVYKSCKWMTRRPRPYAALEAILIGASPLDQYSFPSGHTMHAVAFTIVCTAYVPALLSVLLLFTILVAFSRVILGLHYPSDVLWGGMLGIIIGKLSLLLAAI